MIFYKKMYITRKINEERENIYYKKNKFIKTKKIQILVLQLKNQSFISPYSSSDESVHGAEKDPGGVGFFFISRCMILIRVAARKYNFLGGFLYSMKYLSNIRVVR